MHRTPLRLMRLRRRVGHALAAGWLALLVWMLPIAPAVAGLPEAYNAVVLQPTGTPPGRIEFDLSAVQQRAKTEGKRLYVYLGANDCKFCRKYEAFLAKNTKELVPHFAEKYIVVDLRSSLSVTASALYFRVGRYQPGLRRFPAFDR